ncbi:MAG TPA: toll/interleukin-1 receptor domain-containing protein [Ktedonobacterales bacterium]|jgi:tetratricopeptide (TPR) repeat protein
MHSAATNNSIFISHASADIATINPYIQALRQQGFDVWYDQDKLKGGDSLPLLIQEELERRAVFIVFLTQASIYSRWVQLETATFLSLQMQDPNRLIIPIRVSRVQMPPFLRTFKWVEATELSKRQVVEEIILKIQGELSNHSQLDSLNATSPTLIPLGKVGDAAADREVINVEAIQEHIHRFCEHWAPQSQSDKESRGQLSLRKSNYMNPLLQKARATYDEGNYQRAMALFDELIMDTQRVSALSKEETTQFLYYMAKTLLKLNWYNSLGELMSGPYHRFSETIQHELDAEVLQIEGIRFRQSDDIANSLTCFEQARYLLEKAIAAQPDSQLTIALADVYVLNSLAYLDQALCTKGTAIVREAALTLAKQCLSHAGTLYHELRVQSGEHATHYEGRLKGAQGFVTVAESIIFPSQLTERHWADTELDARGAFEPEHERKAFGIVAGKYALAVIWLAKGQWFLQQKAVPNAAERALHCFRDALNMLAQTYDEHVASGHVFLGPLFEMPKMKRLLLALYTEVTAQGYTPYQSLASLHLSTDELDTIANAPICVYTPIA